MVATVTATSRRGLSRTRSAHTGPRLGPALVSGSGLVLQRWRAENLQRCCVRRHWK